MDYSAKITGLQAQIRANEQTMRALPSNNVKKYNALCSKNSKIKVQIEDLERKRDQERDKVRSKDIANDPNHINPRSAVGYTGKHVLGYSKTDYSPQVVDGVMFSDHAIERTRERGVHSSLVLQAIRTTTPKDSRGNLTFYDKANKLFVVQDTDGTIVTVEIKTILDW